MTAPSPADQDAVVRGFIAAVSEGDDEAIARLAHREIEIHTERTTYRGREAAVAWATKAYDHLIRRYLPDTIEFDDSGARVLARQQYTWRESNEVGDTIPVEIELGIRDGLVSSWLVRDL